MTEKAEAYFPRALLGKTLRIEPSVQIRNNHLSVRFPAEKVFFCACRERPQLDLFAYADSQLILMCLLK
ncbi:hypothetical protein IV417_18575 [Alphaproteobacteria bacterium KMM 3653]|uniref:Uncharacterized protein n=1 Tax=Harenicola maris TaxID=2841044 RepID=A0AAP2CTQ5_9RHOB|nr:hypothetical protein [Harenicola maris]